MNRVAGRTVILFVLILALLGGMVFFTGEFLLKSDKWVISQGSPHIYNGGNIGTGTVVDRDGNLLLDMTDGWKYAPDVQLRQSVIHWLGDRDGFISAPAVSHYASEMAGFDRLNGVYTYADKAGKAVLTLSAELQKAAMDAMEGKKGTVAVYNYRTGEILLSLSTPNYDPDDVPDIQNDTTGAYDGAYVNRFTQSSYIPGSIFKAVTVAAALECIDDIEDREFYCNGVYEIGVDKVTCEWGHGTTTLKTAFANSCNCAFAQLAEELGAEQLQKYVEKFGITDPVEFDGITTAAGNFDVSSGERIDVAWSAIGQHRDQINPCRFMTFMGAIAGGGSCAQPHLVAQAGVGESASYRAKAETTERIMSADTAKRLQELMRFNVENNYGVENFQGLTVCAKTGTAEVGGEEKPNAMFCGFATDEEYPLAFILAVENGGYGSSVCIPLMSEILGACRDYLDGIG